MCSVAHPSPSLFRSLALSVASHESGYTSSSSDSSDDVADVIRTEDASKQAW